MTLILCKCIDKFAHRIQAPPPPPPPEKKLFYLKKMMLFIEP